MKTRLKAGKWFLSLCVFAASFAAIHEVLAQSEPAPAPAEEAQAQTLEERAVRDLFKTLAEFYTFDQPNLEKMMAFIEPRIDPSARFQTEMHINELTQPEFKRYNKKQLLDDIRQNYPKAYESKAKYKIEAIRLSEDGKRVDVNYHVWLDSKFASQEPQTGRKAEIRLRSLSVCDDVLRRAEDLLKIVESKCVQDVSIAKPVFLE
ncbi:MAG: hypothetical protein KJ017_00560 [Alphaproteobacteria bacterium]|nr:hypothetical protein [Alphaproteobacteria bacterium]